MAFLKIIIPFLFVMFTFFQQDTAFLELANAERSFAELSVKAGTKKAFVTYFADDCIVFNPYPVNGKELYQQRPESKSVLSWFPTVIEVSASGDFGFTTGPWEWKPAKDSAAVAFGHFVSVWKKQSEGTWKVILDGGGRYPVEMKKKEPEETRSTKKNHSSLTPDQERIAMLGRENLFSQLVVEEGFSSATEKLSADDVRLHRDGIFPVSGKKDVLTYTLRTNSKIHFKPLTSRVSSSGDLGYTCGIAIGENADSSSYVHLWRKESEWNVVLDLMIPFR